MSTFSTGPIAPSDGIGFSNAALILKSCMADGTLLQVALMRTCAGVYDDDGDDLDDDD